MKKIVFSIVFLSWLFILNSCSSGGGNPNLLVPANPGISAFSIDGATGIISGNNITVTLPFGTNVTSLIVKFTVAAGIDVFVGNTRQISGVTANDFTNPQIYILVPNNKSTQSSTKTSANNAIASYTVRVLVASKTDKAITTFSLSSIPGTTGTHGVIIGRDIALTMPFGTNLSSLTATFTTTGESVLVGTAVQTSGTTANDFTNPVLYTVTAANGSTATYTVTVSVASKFAKEITEFSIAGNSGTITGQNISVIVPHGTNITSAIAAFTATGESVLVNSIPQISESSVNDFSHPVIYTVVAADKSSLDYTVTVTVAPGTAKALIPPFLLDGYPGTINESQLTIDVTVPFGTPLTNMITTFTTTGESVTVNGVIQTSGSLPSHNFESPVAYVVHAADASTATYIVTVHPTSNVWTWMSGSNLINQYGIYGSIPGLVDYSNIPGGRNSSISWIDTLGNLWLFGGNGRAESGNNGSLNDLWKYNPGSGLWTWVSGSKLIDQNGIYGVRGEESASNIPGGRRDSISWIDTSGNLWLFGGFGKAESGFSGLLNDLWKYNPDSGLWTWASGSNLIDQNGIYGIKGGESASNMPGSRNGSVSWIDTSGNLWFFGGTGRTESSNGYLNDLWKYNPGSGLWTWASGSNLIDQNGIYGIKGGESASNMPGSRSARVSWIDASGNMWLFGGFGIAESGNYGSLNDLWKYNPDSGLWTWVSGSKLINQNGIYGVRGEESASNIPGGRWDSISWIDTLGNLWFFGGNGRVESGSNGYLNDLWKYHP